MRDCLQERTGEGIFDVQATVSLFKEKAPGHPGLSPLKRRLLVVALADRIAGQ
jgi:hypothetical protein